MQLHYLHLFSLLFWTWSSMGLLPLDRTTSVSLSPCYGWWVLKTVFYLLALLCACSSISKTADSPIDRPTIVTRRARSSSVHCIVFNNSVHPFLFDTISHSPPAQFPIRYITVTSGWAWSHISSYHLQVWSETFWSVSGTESHLPAESERYTHQLLQIDVQYDYFTTMGVCSCLVVINITQPLARGIIRPGQASAHACCGTKWNNGERWRELEPPAFHLIRTPSLIRHAISNIGQVRLLCKHLSYFINTKQSFFRQGRRMNKTGGKKAFPCQTD